ncbi:hypothetical protein [Pseudomaricurvus sp. HS19]|uniref:hypothetical protein n=1 Tax=Pseudomaricurvus sp. HS19 TaxID=2692626 RepID=UPI0013712476|nr:hypothetical protein [Pseudomaricurvus sp. HS19]MYM64899.1 hypothetical protein [Pseudomaricurvus sp. HS19]
MSRPPFPISAKTNQLRLVNTDTAVPDNAGPAVKSKSPALVRGLAYPASQLTQARPAGLVGGLDYSVGAGRVLPAAGTEPGFLWDWDAMPAGDRDNALASNSLQLQNPTLLGPEIYSVRNTHWLTVKAEFPLHYRSRDFAARLGEIRLVESQRFLTLQDGSRRAILDTGDEPVLYLEPGEEATVLRQQTPWQPQGESRDYCFDYRISQRLPIEAEGQLVQGVTVLEQFTSYFLERPLSDRPGESIWVPAAAPVSWGWSMRAEPQDGGWAITRRKLILPTVGHEGWVLPEWGSNTEECLCWT